MNDNTDHQEKIGIVVSHTHWDREWRNPIWTSRYHLMHFMDSLMDLIEQNVDFHHMVLDGQTVMIQDYLEMAPQQRPRLVSLIKKGKIAIGPWYTLPDLFPVGGESLIRNLGKGMVLCRELGYNPTIAYTTFGWGQSAQMPQIYKGFGLDFIITAKYVSPERVADSEFLWSAPDGTTVLASRLGEDARANFFFNAYIPIRHGIGYKSDAYRYHWGKSTVFRSACSERADEDFRTLVGSGSYHADQVTDGIMSAWNAYDATTVDDVRLLLCGSDATEASQILPRIIKEGQESGIRLVHGSLETYVALLRERLVAKDLQVVEGELRDGPAAAVTGNALAVRVRNKQLNALVEMQLTRYAEPLLAWAAQIGSPVAHADTFTQRAWEYLLKAHSHDSINGVGQDKNSEDTAYRLRQAKELASVLTDSAVGEILKRIDTAPFKRDETLLFVYNPLSRGRRSTLSISVDIPLAEHAWTISLVDSTGTRYPVQVLDRNERLVAIDDPDARPWTYDCQRIEGLFTTGSLPPCGWEIYAVRIDERFERNRIWPPARVTEEASIGYADSLENRFVKATVLPDGTVRLEDKLRGKVYSGLLSLEDTGDVGDYWVHSPAYHGKTILSTAIQARVMLGPNGPEEGQLIVELEIDVPAGADMVHQGLTNEGYRSDHLTKLSVTHSLSLRKTEPFLRVRTKIENRAKDHRLRFRLPLGFQAVKSASMSHFHLDTRAVEPSVIPGRSNGYWPDMQTHPMRRCVDVSDGVSSLAVLTESFFEWEVERTGMESTLVLTAFRSVRNKICTEYRTYTDHTGQEGGQSLGTLAYEYALYPHGNDPDEVPVLQVADEYLLDPLAYQFSASAEGTLSGTQGMLSIDNPQVQLSAIIAADEESDMVVRLWNASDQSQSCTLTTYHPIAFAAYASLDGTSLKDSIPAHDHSIRVRLGPCEIVTLVIGA